MLQIIFNQIKRSGTVKDVSFLSLGQFLAQLLSLAVIFYVPKSLGVEKYGDYQIILNYVMMFKLVTFTGLNKVNIRRIARSKDTEEINTMMSTALGVRIIAAIFGVLISIAVVGLLSYQETIVNGVLIFSLFLVLFAIENHLFSIFYGTRKLKYLAVINLVKSLLLSSSMIAIVLVSQNIVFMLFAYLIVESLIILISYLYAIKKCDFILQIDLNLGNIDIPSALRFSLIDLFNLLSSRVDLFMLSLLTTPSNVGVYAIATTIVRKGLIVRRSIAQAIFPKYAEEKDKLNIKLLLRHTFFITLMALVMSLAIYFIMPVFITRVIGNEYASGIPIVKVLAFYLVFHYAVIPFATFLEVIGKEANVIWIGFIRAIINIGLNYFLFKLFGIVGIAYSTLVIWAVNLIFNYYLAQKSIKA